MHLGKSLTYGGPTTLTYGPNIYAHYLAESLKLEPVLVGKNAPFLYYILLDMNKVELFLIENINFFFLLLRFTQEY